MSRHEAIVDTIIPTKRLTVACVLRSGGDYGRDYVVELAAGLLRHMHRPFDMVCLTDVPEEVHGICHPIRLKHDYPGWWSKIELFRLVGDVLFFDLDTIVKGDISELADNLSWPFDFAMLEDFNMPGWGQSSVMAWQGDFSHLYYGFPENETDRFPRGDQQFISSHVTRGFLQDPSMYPGMFASYKWSSRGEKERAPVICFHGQPRPHHVNWEWR